MLTRRIGTGKSVLLREIIRRWREDQDGSLAITATTGVAALNIGGQTIHSWSGIGVGRLPFERLKWKIRKNPILYDRWRKVQCIVLDESGFIQYYVVECSKLIPSKYLC